MTLRKILCKCTAAAVLLAVVFSTTTLVNAQAVQIEEPSSTENGTNEVAQSVSDGFEYEVSNGGAVITGYTGSSRTVNIPDTIDGYVVWKIGEKAFNGKNIISVTIPASVTTLGNLAFANCSNLSIVKINCTELADADSGSAAQGILFSDETYSVFYNSCDDGGCRVIFGEGVTRIPAYLFATAHDKSNGVYCRISSVKISSTVTEIGKCAFFRCYNLSTLEMGDNVRTIGNAAFRYDDLLKTTTLPSSLTSIGGNAFGNTGLQSLTIPKNVVSIGDMAFANCGNLTDMTIEATALEDANSASAAEGSVGGDEDCSVFYNSGSLSGFKVTFTEGVTRIPGYLFATGHNEGTGTYCKISEVIIPDSATEIGDGAFKFCFKLASVKMGKNIQSIGLEAFSSVKVTSFTIPSKVTKIGKGAFGYCKNLTKMTINAVNLADGDSFSTWASDGWGIYDTKTSIFYNTGSLDGFEVVFGNGVTKIPAYLFATGHEESSNVNCHISKVVIPYSVQSIGTSAFGRCYNLKNVTYVGTKTQWNNTAIENDNEYLTNASISYITPAKITQQPSNISATLGSTAKFTVAASGTSLKYQWQWSSDGGKTWKNSTSATTGYNSATLQVKAEEARDGYKYRCVVSNTYTSATSNAATLTIKASMPVISTQPKNVSTTSGSTAKFTVTASGISLKYQWQWSEDGGKTWKDSSSATTGYRSATLQVKAEEKRNGYKYRCKVTNSAGTATTNAVTFTITNVKPAIRVQPTTVYGKVGTTVKFSITAAGSSLKYQWQWSSDGGSTWKDSTSATTGYRSAALQVAVTESRKGYKYRCKVSNSYGSVTSGTATLGIAVKPTISTQPKSATVYAGTAVNFTVKASGGGLTYQWYFRAAGTTEWKKSTKACATTNTYKLSASDVVKSRNGYQYKCVITNAAGSVTSSVVTLNVK